MKSTKIGTSRTIVLSQYTYISYICLVNIKLLFIIKSDLVQLSLSQITHKIYVINLSDNITTDCFENQTLSVPLFCNNTRLMHAVNKLFLFILKFKERDLYQTDHICGTL